MSEQTGRQMPVGKLMKRFLPYFRRYKTALIFDLFCAALTTVCEIVFPLIVREITNRAMVSPDTLTIPWVLKLGLLYLLLRIIDTLGAYYMQSRGHFMGARIETDMRRDLFDHLEHLSFAYYNNTKIGQLMARLTSDLFDIAEFAHHCPEEFFIAGVKIVVSFVILLNMNIGLTLLVFALVPLMIVLLRHFNQRMRAAFKECRHEVGEMNARIEDSLLGVRVVQSFANEPLEQDKFNANNQNILSAKIRQYIAMAGFGSVTRTFEGVMYILVVVAGAILLAQHKLIAGDYVAYILFIGTLLTSIRRIVDYMEQFQRGLTGLERFTEIMEVEPDVEDSPDAVPLENVHGDVAFEDVSFHYSDDKSHEVLTHINESIKSGTSVAIVGPSGSGKTTLCSLIPRFYDVTGGRVTIDGHDVRSVTKSSLRQSIGVVQQEVYLFSGTVIENILYGRPGATREDAMAAAKRAGADEFIDKLPNGYDTYIGERGVKLSGGQKQRLSIARVFLKDPPILVLDEATSALDNESERYIQESLRELAKGRTTFTIAHRLTTIRNADVIWVLTENGIEESGDHETLMQKNGLYAGLYKLYC
ncbi:MAG: ABC transporter ATP-binding protein [Clostridia bacterium]|nr:ABC transporter ATP-binding protein [Clostridia bacterium]